MKTTKRILAVVMTAVLILCSASLAFASVTLTTTGKCNLRTGPSLDDSTITSIPSGTTLTATGRSYDDRGVQWYKVKYNGRTGWVSSKYAKEGGSSTGTTIKTTGSCNLRRGPGLDYSSITTIPSGTSLKATSSSTDDRGVKWYKVSYDGHTGWVSSVYAKKGSSTTSKVVATGDTYIRSGANKSSSKLGILYDGESATYLNKSSVDSRGVRWYKITHDGVTGWVSSVNSYVK